MADRMTAAQLRASSKGANKGRVRGTKPITVDGIRFDSTREARRWQVLSLLEKQGHIYDLKRQVPIPLFGQCGPVLTPTARHMTYRADFTYRDARIGDALVIEDPKGWQTDVSKIKLAILAAQGVDVTLV